ncbi:DUF1028 domain-containing protein [Roseinatronobacter alkalisoli]|uniref:DUF1028 domain-containing protein n=1 Tax=Roseinatronobacter alkalisoli TaxID=3028235 RepID=A0ABT5TA23_9RHOB|nr:DUF1028 domain-containing protein [Roseinatronobacter sp. HJB301]MDD7971824.1 DUF1028 domain-containing protein [Roseinatronobacter sp. HJB301]
MTFSILAQDLGSGAMGGAAATGALCVGGWVLRGDSRAGMTASQGAAPSTMWGEDALESMRSGQSAEQAVTQVTAVDRGRAWRQLSALDRHGGTASHSGQRNTPWCGSVGDNGFVVSGNMLAGPQVLDALRSGFLTTTGTFAERLLAGLRAAEAAGGDSRGLQSAALLIVSDDAPPLNLRIDWAQDPLSELHDLYRRSQTGAYAEWLPTVPTRNNPERGHD